MDKLFQIAVLRTLIFLVNGRLSEETTYEGTKLLNQLTNLLPLFEYGQGQGK
jgi:hypothetical protein